MTGLWDAERDAGDVARVLDGLAAILRRDSVDLSDPDLCRRLRDLVEDGGATAARVADYLGRLRGAGDGAAATVPPRLAPWRDWVPARGPLASPSMRLRRTDEVPHPRRGDPGE